MKITGNTVTFDKSDNPVKENLTLKAQELLPNDYQGVNPSAILADVYSNKIEAGLTVNELSSITVDEVPDIVDSVTVAGIVMSRFGLTADSNDFVALFYSMAENLDFNDRENIYYLAQLYTYVKPLVKSNSIGSTVRHLYSLKRGRDEAGRVPISEIRKFILLNKALRAEGVVLTATEVFYCSLNWAEGEVFQLLETGLSLSEAIKLYDIGFKSIDEIVEYSGGVPTDWIDLILG